MKVFEIKVRRDGAINLRKKNNALMGIKPGSHVKVTLDDVTGTITLKPDGYYCNICGKSFSKPLDAFGNCAGCNDALISSIRAGLSSSIPEAYNEVRARRGIKVVGKR